MNREKRESARRFTEDEMRMARETDLPDLLAHLGYHVKKGGAFLHHHGDGQPVDYGPPQMVSVF